MGIFCTITALAPFMIDVEAASLTATLNEAVLEAETQIRTALAPRYDVSSDYFTDPADTPPIISTICKQFALAHAHEALARGGKDAYLRADRYKKRGDELLKAIVDRTADVVDQSGNVLEERADAFYMDSNTKNYKETFDEDSPISWNQDATKLDDIADERDA